MQNEDEAEGVIERPKGSEPAARSALGRGGAFRGAVPETISSSGGVTLYPLPPLPPPSAAPPAVDALHTKTNNQSAGMLSCTASQVNHSLCLASRWPQSRTSQ